MSQEDERGLSGAYGAATTDRKLSQLQDRISLLETRVTQLTIALKHTPHSCRCVNCIHVKEVLLTK